MLQKTVAMAMVVAVLGMLPMGQVSAANANGAIAQGVDASKHNGAVNWGQVAASGMQFAFIKVEAPIAVWIRSSQRTLREHSLPA